MTKVLITDPIDQSGIEILSHVAQVDQKIGICYFFIWKTLHFRKIYKRNEAKIWAKKSKILKKS